MLQQLDGLEFNTACVADVALQFDLQCPQWDSAGLVERNGSGIRMRSCTRPCIQQHALREHVYGASEASMRIFLFEGLGSLDTNYKTCAG